MRRNFNGAMLALLLAAVTTAPALARGNDLVIKDGMGEQIEIRNGFFGRKTTVVKDRLGNGYSTKTGLFGSKDTNVSVMGNNLTRKKGIFGSTEVQGNTIFGDKVTTKKGLFGRRTTEVDVSGTSNVLKGLWSKFGPELMGKTAAAAPAAPVTQMMPPPDQPIGSPADLISPY
jgi:hypothetical protein